MRCYTALDIPTYVSKINVSLNIMVAMATAITILPWWVIKYIVNLLLQ